MLVGLRGGIAITCAVSLGCALACGTAPRPPINAAEIHVPEQPPPEEVAAATTSNDVNIVPADPVMLSSVPDGGAAAANGLPIIWSASFTFGHTKPFAEAIANAKESRRNFDRTAGLIFHATADGGVVAYPGTLSSKDFERASSLLDLTSRLYAAAYHAPNVTMQNRVDTLHDAGDMILAWSRKLDEAGLAKAPASLRADPAVALTFEDVANGPAKRWREEGLAIVQLCVELSKTNKIDDASARDCTSMRHTYARIPTRKVASTNGDGGSPAACACDPGDPLCSASMSGWCRPGSK